MLNGASSNIWDRWSQLTATSTTDVKARLTIARHATLQAADGDLESKRYRYGPKDTTCKTTDLEYRIIWVRKLGAEEVRWETSNSVWDVGMASDAENQLDRMENQHMDSGRRLVYQKKKASWSKLSIGNSLSTAIGKEELIASFWLQLRVKKKENVFLGEEEQHG